MNTVSIVYEKLTGHVVMLLPFEISSESFLNMNADTTIDALDVQTGIDINDIESCKYENGSLIRLSDEELIYKNMSPSEKMLKLQKENNELQQAIAELSILISTPPTV